MYVDCFTGLAGFLSQLEVANYIEYGTCKCGQTRTSRFPLIPLKVNFHEAQDLARIQNNIIFHNKKNRAPFASAHSIFPKYCKMY